MGQKVNPVGIRLGITRDWTSRWLREHPGVPGLHPPGLAGARVPEEEAVRGLRQPDPHRACRRRANITINTARPGVVIGKKARTSSASGTRSRR